MTWLDLSDEVSEGETTRAQRDEIRPMGDVEPIVPGDEGAGDEYEEIATIRDFDADYNARRSDQGRLEVMRDYDVHPSELRPGFNMDDLREVVERKLSKLQKQSSITPSAVSGESGRAPTGDSEAQLHEELARLNSEPMTHSSMMARRKILDQLGRLG